MSSDAPTIPGWSRTSDVRNLVLTDACPMGVVLNWLYPDEVQGTVWWVLGRGLHKGIELTITDGLSYPEGLYECHLEADILLHANRKVGTIESTRKGAKRSLETIPQNIDDMYETWWNNVHPSSTERLFWYDDYEWPPLVEYMIEVPGEVDRSGAPLYTEVDAIFLAIEEDFRNPVAIVDWKTGASKTADPSQLHIYRYGLHMEDRDGRLNGPAQGWFPDGTGGSESNSYPLVGWFHHLNENKIQLVDPYVGNTVVQHWLTMTSAYKRAMIEENTIVATNSYLCRNYNNAGSLCPACGDSNEDTKTWAEVLGRLERAELLPAPEGNKDG